MDIQLECQVLVAECQKGILRLEYRKSLVNTTRIQIDRVAESIFYDELEVMQITLQNLLSCHLIIIFQIHI